MSLRIVSLNAWGGRVYAPLMRYLVDVDADVICLQEVVRTPATTSAWLVYRDHDVELPQRANLFDEIRAALPSHDAFFCPTARGTLFDGNEEIPSEFGLATFVRRSLAVIGQASDFVHGEFSPDGWGPHPRARNAHCVRLFSYEDGFPVTIVQMHGLRDLSGKGDTPARERQTEALIEVILNLWRGDERLVVCGDFNVRPESGMFGALADLGLADLVTARGHTDTRTSYYEKPGRFADYMLVTPDVEVVGFDVVAQPEVSDHRALLLEMR
ncbi:endonuclease/exonuclease/phosphatase family protein [Rhizobium giardinii]|jgi:endonuclease/exonuclease/phosphatase family metal-dependent hydrolase|uniref:Endonuclease/exonuclease/phosphatase family metal-dependent hydrolase n=1 Tax=Rhizobium giardinii TaxID=56731 RepID=A0A7W8U8V6_9HYPH|nr:endonuclease/exonuclease/phosphatase family protein [Rhizobium giardinii]MBB5534853.1 endonuclease/exonuclease/phosphatase family metal-dependent hydrolase [Rhizobium giardinii]